MSSREGEQRVITVIKVRSSPRKATAYLRLCDWKRVDVEGTLWKSWKQSRRCYLWDYLMGMSLTAH